MLASVQFRVRLEGPKPKERKMIPKLSHLIRSGLALAVLIVPAVAQSDTWQLKVGARIGSRPHLLLLAFSELRVFQGDHHKASDLDKWGRP
jgi:hypothetical protein